MTDGRKFGWAIVVCLLFWAAGASLSLAQIKSGTITGLVTDKTGAVVPGAQVTVINEGTQVAVQVKSDSAGAYTVPYLEVGRYTVTVDKQGFSILKETGVEMDTGQLRRVDVQLQVGTVGTTVNVLANAAALQTESTTQQGSVESRVIESVPELNHNPYYFAGLVPGVVAQNNMLGSTVTATAFGVGMISRQDLTSFSVNGSPGLSSDLLVDGVSVIGPASNEAEVLPNRDGIAEVRVLTNDYTAEYGRGQGVVVITTKSGTNSLHGTLFNSIRNDALNANTFSNDALGIKKAPFKVDYYGGSAGGPILKNRLFFFAGLEGLAHPSGAQWLERVPTALERVGNFSQTLVNVSGVPTPLQLFNPFSVTQVSSNLWQRAQYPNAIIPNPDPYAVALFSNYPLPNHTPSDVYNTGNYFYQATQMTKRDDVNARFDYTRGAQSFYLTGGLHWGKTVIPQPWGPNNPFWVFPTNGSGGSSAPITDDRNPFVGVGDTITISPTLVADVRFGLQRNVMEFAQKPTPNFNYDQYGIPKSIQAIFAIPGIPIDYARGNWGWLAYTLAMHQINYQTNFSVVGSLTKSIGRWTLKQGAEERTLLYIAPNQYQGSVQVVGGNYNAEYTDAFGDAVPQNTTAATQGFYDAAPLSGAGDLQITAGQSVVPENAAKAVALYSQNDWRATSRLTVNLGLRWDLQLSPTERHNRESTFDSTKTNTWGTPGILAFVGTDGYSRHEWDTQWGDFQPRVGLAYKISDTLVVRGGYGLTYLPSNTGLLQGPWAHGAFPFSTYINNEPYGLNPAGVLAGTYTDGTIVNIATHGPGANPAAPQNYGTSPNLFSRRMLDGRVQQWNVFFEKRLRGGWLTSIGYTGNHGGNLFVARFPLSGTGLLPNSLTQQCYRDGINCPAQDSAVNGAGYIQTGVDPANAKVTNPWNPTGTLPFGGSLAAATIPRYMLDSPYPMFTGATNERTFGWSNYDAMTVEVKHAYSNGLQLDAHYTWSKNLSYTGTEAANGNDSNVGFDSGTRYLQTIKNNYHITSTDIPHRLVVTAVYALPFGAKRRFALDSSGIVRGIASGWKIGGVEIIQSGFPFPISGGTTGSLNSLPNRVPGEPLKVPKSLQHWYNGKTTVTLPDGRQITPQANSYLLYNVDAFAGQVIPSPTAPGKYIADDYWYGDAGIDYNQMRISWRSNLDLTLSRNFRLTERFALEFRADATNSLNHPEFGASGYNGSIGSTNVTLPSASNGNTQLGQGMGSSTFGTYGQGTYDPRQIELGVHIRF